MTELDEPIEGEEPEQEPGPATEPDEDEAAEDEEASAEPQEPAGAVPASPTDIAYEKAAKAAEKRWSTFRSAVLGIWSADAEYLYECPLCPSQHKGFVDIRFAGHIPDELAESVTSYLRGAEQEHYAAAPNIAQCTVCQGLGKVQTGSRVPSHDLITCPVCKGYGYSPPPGAQTQAAAATNGHADSAPMPSSDFEDVDRDNWGEPRTLPDGTLNENFGKMPQFKAIHPVFGVTAGLKVPQGV